MLKKYARLAIAALMALPTTLSAQSFKVDEHYVLPVAAIDANSFEVIEDGGAGNPQLWCAAGIYARKVLGARGGDIYVETARGPSQTMPGRKAVVFTTTPVADAFTSATLGVRRAGASHSMTHAYALCRSQFRMRIRTGTDTLIRS